jgi:threonine dehydratase
MVIAQTAPDPMTLPSLAALRSAADTVHRVIPPTPQICWPLLCERTGTEVWVKHENHTPLGSFKIRGGVLYVEELMRKEPNVSEVIAATRGNHGQSIAFAAHRAGIRTLIVTPHGNSREKNAAMRALGARLIEHGTDFQEAHEYAATLVEARGLHFVRSFNETQVRGVASYALELFGAVRDLDAIYVPVGLGSGICGTIAVRNALGLKTEVIGVVAEGAPAYALSAAAGRLVSSETVSTIADGMACRVPDPTALEIILAGTARLVLVTDSEIRAAMRHLFTDTHNVAEGAGAAALAALIKERTQMKGRRVAIVQSGGNVDRDVFAQVLNDVES